MRFFLIPVLILLLVPPAMAGEQVLTLDPEQTNVSLLLEATGHDVHGHLYLESATLRLDLETGSASGTVVIDARRTETGSKRRDRTMHKKVLESEEHPQIVFSPRTVRGEISASGSSRLELEGILTILGTEHEVTLPVDLKIDGQTVSGSTRFTVPYVEWGMHDPSIAFLRVAKVVEVEVEAMGTWSSGEPSVAGGV